jgi:uncharacterized protein (TIGR03067 family)
MRVLPLFALVSLAFAPAPLPKQLRPENSVAVKNLVGNWEVTQAQRTEDKGALLPVETEFRAITITLTRWVFHSRPQDVSYDLRTDPDKMPAEFQLAYHGQQEPLFQGIIERRGNVVRVIYSSRHRPTSFKNQPNCYVLTLKRQ